MEIDLNLPAVGRKLLKEYEDKKLTEAEFDKECAYWMMFYPNSLKWTRSPIMPNDLIDYQKRKRCDAKFEVADSFWQQPHIKEYTQKESLARASNLSNKHWLSWLKKVIPAEDTPSHKKLDDIICTYPKLEL